MTGPYDSVIGVKKELVVNKFLNGMPVRFERLPAMSASLPSSLTATKIPARPATSSA